MYFSEIEVPPTYYLIDNPKKFSWLVKELRNTSEFAYDLETNVPTGSKNIPDDYDEKICGISFAWGRTEVQRPWKPGTAAYIPLSRSDDSDFWGAKQDSIIQVLKDDVFSTPALKIAHNVYFDFAQLYKLLGIRAVNTDFCTLLAHVVVDEDRRHCYHRLKSSFNAKGVETFRGCANHYLDIDASVFKREMDDSFEYFDPKYKRYSKIPLKILYPYGCADSDLALSLKFIFEDMMRKEETFWVFSSIVMPLCHVLMKMKMHGAPLDIARAEQVRDEQTAILDEMSAQIHQIIGKTFDISSPKQLGSVLFEQLCLPGGKRNKEGWITDADMLKTLDHPVIEPLLKWKKAHYINSSWAQSCLSRYKEVTHNGRIGWIHADFEQTSVTGRLIIKNPNLTTYPRPENGGMIVKSMFAGGEDYRFVFADESQFELRVAAHYSQEPLWLEYFRQGYDLHSGMAQKVFKLDCAVEDVDRLYHSKRSDAKSVNFGIIYGESIWGLSKDLGITVEEAEVVIDDYFREAPVLKRYVDGVHEFARQNGYVVNLFGRRRHLPEAQIVIPSGEPWPPYQDRPKCYAQGPRLYELGLDSKDPDVLKDLRNPSSSLTCSLGSMVGSKIAWKYGDCIRCHFLRSCLLNTEVKKLSSAVGHALRQAINAPIQGGAVDMVNLALIWIDNELITAGLDAAPMLHTHDEICIYSHVSCVEQVCRIMKDCMTTRLQEFTGFSVPLVADTVVVSRISEKHEKED